MSGRIDSHCHFWQLGRGDYGWLQPDNAALAPIYRDWGPQDLDPLAQEAGIERRILVQAAPTVAETRFLLDVAAADPSAGGVVGWVDLAAQDAAQTIAQLATFPLFKGVRPMLQDLDEADWIATRPRPDAIEALLEHGLSFDALVLPRNLASLRQFTARYPDLPVVIDHAAKPAIAAPADDPRHALWRDGMAELAQDPRICCKLSGLLTEMAPEQRSTVEMAVQTLEPVLDRLLDWFGPERLLWGSDWPVLTLAAPFAFWTEVTDHLLADLSQTERAAILGGNAARFYRLPEGART